MTPPAPTGWCLLRQAAGPAEEGGGGRVRSPERPLAESIRGRVSRNLITTPAGEVVVEENQMITSDQAHDGRELAPDKILASTPMTCQAPLGVNRLCYGMDLATGALVEEGMAVGIVIAQLIGELGTRVATSTIHITVVERLTVEESEAQNNWADVVEGVILAPAGQSLVE
jgi:DNA-directed RNA polymerase subunit beta'